MNRVELLARLAQAEPLRHTPAGLPVLRMQLEHESEVLEAGLPRAVTLSLKAVALGELAVTLARVQADSEIQVVGFLAPQRQGSDRLVLHIQQLVSAH
ncbi:primosomal replication protein N [Castellaniella caeni]